MGVSKYPRRLVVEVTIDDHMIIKCTAARENLTVRNFVLQAVQNEIARVYISREPRGATLNNYDLGLE